MELLIPKAHCLNSIRFGIMDTKSTQDLDNINNPVFTKANKVFGKKCVELKQQGLAKVKHTPLTCKKDLQKLNECGVFDVNSPVTLQNKVLFFKIMLYFCSGERQKLCQLKKSLFRPVYC